MDGIHDLGGMHGFGAVRVERDEPVFHARWEGRVWALNLLLLGRGVYHIDAFRHGIETMAPLEYLRASYYERWRASVEANLIRAGVIGAADLAGRARELETGAAPLAGRRVAALPPSARSHPADYAREIDAPPRFSRGDRVRARNVHPAGHTRLPRYVRGRLGRVERVHPAGVFPDTNAHGLGESPQHLYGVRFEAGELWGEVAEPDSSVHLDLFEAYLEPVG